MYMLVCMYKKIVPYNTIAELLLLYYYYYKKCPLFSIENIIITEEKTYF